MSATPPSIPPLSDSANADARHWQRAAVYLASCHAATLESLPKSASSHLRRRLTSICEVAAEYMRHTRSPGITGMQGDEHSRQWTVQRCEAAAARYGVGKVGTVTTDSA